MPRGAPSSSTTGNQPSAVISIGKWFFRTSGNGVMASNITAGLQSVLLIEHWYPGKYSVTCTLTVLPAMVASGTMLPPPAGSAPPCRHQRRWLPGFSTFPAAGQSYGMGFTLQAALVVPPFV